MRLLIVEDNVATRQMIKRTVAPFAKEIIECDDGTDAVDLYAAEQPDWVLMDIRLNKLDGISATQQIRASYPNARIVIVTSFDEAGFREAAHRAGACGYVLKQNLLDLQRLLERKKG
jgi:CheY-like chemotaxis protein